MHRNAKTFDALVDKPTPDFFCARCHELTKHESLYGDCVEWQAFEPGDPSYGHVDYDHHFLLRCTRCKWTIYVRDYVSPPLPSDRANGAKDDVSRSVYPGKHVQRPVWLELFNGGISNSYCFKTSEPKLYALVEQMYVCLDNDAYTAAALMSRSLLETVMLRSIKNDTGSLAGNVKAMRDSGKLSHVQANQLEKYALEVGHASMHRSHNPHKREVMSAVNFVTNLIETLYVTERMMEVDLELIPKHNLNP